MIASRNTGVERVSTLQGQKIAMSIDLSAESVASMVRSMIDLYKDQEGACVREYSTNAWDAHVQASIDGGGTATHYSDGSPLRPVEVELPGPLSPFLMIRDYGIGLSVQDIVEVYSKYGASTKRESNEVQGMLGYGCKAALSYTPQFTVTSVKDGVRAQVAVSREGDGGGSMQIVDTSTTTEPNGTTITIPVRQQHSFEDKARLFFSFWEPGTVLVNGAEPEKISGLPIGDKMTVITAPEDVYGGRGVGKSYVVMGKVAYPTIFPGLTLGRGYGLVARVDIGDVNFTPSREGLMEQDPDTLATLRRVVSEFDRLAPGAIQKQIDAVSTAHEALSTMIRYQSMLPNARRVAYTYRNKPLPSTYDFRNREAMLSTRRSSALGSSTRVWDYDASVWADTLWLEGYDGTKFTATHKRKILQWCGNNGKDHLKNFMQLAGTVPFDIRRYVEPSNIIAWQTIKDEKLPTNIGNSGGYYSGYKTKSITGSFEAWVYGDFKGEVAASSFDTAKPIYFRRGNRQQNRQLADLLFALAPNATFVCVPGNRVAKFQRDFPKAIEAYRAALQAFDAWKGQIGGDVLHALALADTGQRDFFASLDMLRVNDPDIKRAIRLAKIDLTGTEERRKLFSYAMRGQLTLPSFDNPMTKYPLFRAQYGHYTTPSKSALDHFYLYVNAAYAADKKGA